MGEGSLSQDEIDALLQGVDEASSGGGSPGGFMGSSGGGVGDSLSPGDTDVIAEILNQAFSVGAGTLGTILSKNVKFTGPVVQTKSHLNIENALGNETVVLYLNISGSVNGRACLVAPARGASGIINVMMGGMSFGEVDEAQLQTLKDSLSPLMGTVISQISGKIGGGLNGSPSDIKSVHAPPDLMLPPDDSLVDVQFNVLIDGQDPFKIDYIFSLGVARDIVRLSKTMGSGSKQGGGGIAGNFPVEQQPVDIKSVAFPSLSSTGGVSTQTNLNLLLDVQMSVTVELGRTKMYIKDILSLGEGSIIELDKLAGEPVDLLVNGKLIAKGEVVVIDENFGVRVTDIVSPVDRIKGAKK